MTARWTDLCALSDLQPGHGQYVETAHRDLAVVLADDETVHVLDNRCPHAGGSLSAGAVRDGCLICPWHMWAFDLNSGACPPVPSIQVNTYPCRVRDGRVEADLSRASR